MHSEVILSDEIIGKGKSTYVYEYPHGLTKKAVMKTKKFTEIL